MNILDQILFTFHHYSQTKEEYVQWRIWIKVRKGKGCRCYKLSGRGWLELKVKLIDLFVEIGYLGRNETIFKLVTTFRRFIESSSSAEVLLSLFFHQELCLQTRQAGINRLKGVQSVENPDNYYVLNNRHFKDITQWQMKLVCIYIVNLKYQKRN